jgi:hypothetical protein
LYTVKNGENVVKNENKRYFRVQRTRINYLNAPEHNLDFCNRFYVCFIQKLKKFNKFFLTQMYSVQNTLGCNLISIDIKRKNLKIFLFFFIRLTFNVFN